MRYSTLRRTHSATRAAMAVVAAIGTAVAPQALGACSAPSGFPRRPLTIVVPYGPSGGSAQVAQMMAKAVTQMAKGQVNGDYQPAGVWVVGRAP